MPTREELFSAVFSVHYIQVNTKESVERVWKLFQQYDGRRSKDNYTRESFERSIKRGRMSDGVLVVRYNDVDAAFFCMTNHKNWLFINRQAQFGMRGLPLGSGVLVPAAIKIAKAKGRHGLAFAFNEHNMIIRDILAGNKCVKPERFSRNRYADVRDHFIFTAAADVMSKMISIERPIFLNNTKQYAMYLPFTDKTPPFLDYEESQTTS